MIGVLFYVVSTFYVSIFVYLQYNLAFLHYMDILNELFKYLTDSKSSVPSKIVGVIVIIIAILFIDNYLGFSFYYDNEQKITQISQIELMKKGCDNPEMIKFLNETEYNILDRKNIIDNFLSLFSKDPLDNKRQFKSDTLRIVIYDTIKIVQLPSTNLFLNDSIYYNDILQDTINLGYIDSPNKVDSCDSNVQIINNVSNETKTVDTRSKLWNTLSSSWLLVLLMIFMPFMFFIQNARSWGLAISVIISIGFIICLIWLNQMLFGLIPILYKPWVNYILNFVVSTTFWIILGIKIKHNADKMN